MAKITKIETLPEVARYHIRHGIHSYTYDIPHSFTAEETERTLFGQMKAIEAQAVQPSMTDKKEANRLYNGIVGKKLPWYRRFF